MCMVALAILCFDSIHFFVHRCSRRKKMILIFPFFSERGYLWSYSVFEIFRKNVFIAFLQHRLTNFLEMGYVQTCTCRCEDVHFLFESAVLSCLSYAFRSMFMGCLLQFCCDFNITPL